MATWNSTPSVPHTGGTFNFPQNTTSNDMVYTIKYTDDSGCTASTTYTVPTCNCDKYGWTASTLYEDAKDNVGGTVGTSLSSAGTLVLYDKPNWVEYLTASTSQDVISYICKAKYNGGRPRRGDVIFRSPDGNCEFSSTVEQAAQVTPVNIMFTGLPSNLSSGNLIMTGSTYAADFTLAGPNAGNGTVYGVLDTTESRELMTFAGQFTTDTGGGGNIVNSCGGTSTSHMYTVLTASWNATTNTLNVTFGECT